jgi:2'-5' RNA ligase
MNIRCFIAVNLTEEVRKSLADVISELRKSRADVKWIPPGNIHLTLKFLGNTDDSLVPAISESLSKKLSHYKPFYIKIADVGCFPSEKHPRVIWIGMEGADELKEIQKDVDAEISTFGFAPDDRPFSPHLTIGRVRSARNLTELMKYFEGFKAADFGTIAIRDIHIMKSDLKPAGAEYSSLAEIPLGTGRNDGG